MRHFLCLGIFRAPFSDLANESATKLIDERMIQNFYSQALTLKVGTNAFSGSEILTSNITPFSMLPSPEYLLPYLHHCPFDNMLEVSLMITIKSLILGA